MSNLADDFFCIVLDEHSGWPKPAPRVAGLGLAAAMLCELTISGHALVDEDGIHALNVRPPVDRLTQQVHELLLSRPQHRDPTIWLNFLARDAFDDVGTRLTEQGIVEPVRRRRLTGSRTVYLPVDLNAFAWPAVRIAGDLTRGEQITLADLTCVGLAVAVGVINDVLWDNDLHVAARAALPMVLARLPEPLALLLSRTETLVADAVLTNRT